MIDGKYLSFFNLLSFKLNDEKSALMKEISRLEKLAKEFERELDQVNRFLCKDKFSEPIRFVFSYVILYVNVVIIYNRKIEKLLV